MVHFQWENLFRSISKEKKIIQHLQQNYLFKDLTQLEIKLVEKIVNIRSYRPGETVFRQGDIGVGLYIISKGTVNIYVEEVVPQSGAIRSHHVTQLKEGDFFGDLALIEKDSLRTASAMANDECTLIGFFKPDLMEITQRNPSVGVKILFRLSEILGTRLKETTRKITELKKSQKEGKASVV